MRKIIIFLVFLTAASADYPQWLQNSLKVVADFKKDSGIHKYIEGYGLAINDSLVLTSASLVYKESRADDILIYNTEVLGEPISCLSHAKIIAVDTNLDIAILSLERFTDIYCNILPEPNFREIAHKEIYFDFLNTPLFLPLDSRLEISYFLEHDWSQFLRVRIPLKEFLNFEEDKKQKLLGMPLFVEDEFLGLKVKNSKNAKDGILTHRQILGFLCELEQNTSVLKNRDSVKKFCENSW
ncbi:MAG: hypothetical protein SOW25_08045 [Helicobacter sp.]|nr:hypothetical protein [Helicobacteraceae bacterium]MDY3114256.1 hypothetical protein [Helicobacter sp.]